MNGYAEVVDYQRLLGGQASEDVDDALLVRASRVVDDLTAGVPYRLTADGTPAEERISGALTEATCLQAHYMDEVGDPSGSLAAMGGAAIGSVRLASRADGQGAQDARYAPEAVQALRRVGLLNRRVGH